MKKKLNPIQKQAIENLDSSILLRAGAGAGKTMVLTSRLVEIIEKKGTGTRILAITFTKKASQEMKTRVQRALAEKGYRGDLENTRIQTIDSFCGDLVRTYALDLNVSPDFKVIEEAKSRRILERIIRDRVRDYYKRAPLFKGLLNQWDMDFGQMETEIGNLYMTLRQNGHIAAFEAKDHRPSQEDLDQALARARGVLEFFLEEGAGKKNKLTKLLGSQEGQAYFSGQMDLDQEEDFISQVVKSIGSIAFAKERKADLEEVLSLLEKKREGDNQAYISLMGDFLREIDRAFWEEKRSRGYMDFGDLLEQSLVLARDPKIKEELEGLFDFVLVDEFQDTNQWQIALIQVLGRRANLFLVGDKKQSIYGFRGASVASSIQAGRDLAAQGGLVLSMEDNYRTRPQLMDYINKAFQDRMEDYQVLRGHGQVQVGEFGLVDLRQEGASRDQGILAEAHFIADRVEEFLGQEDQYSMGLLLRTKSKMEAYEEVFRERGIPFINRSSKGFFETREVKDLMILLRYLQRPQDPLAYLGFLRTPFVGLSDSAIYYIFKDKREDIGIEDLEREKRGQDIIGSCQDLARTKTVYDLVYHILYDLGYLGQVRESKPGQQGQQNLLLFLDLAREYDKDQAKGLGAFLDYMEDKRKYEDLAQADMPAQTSFLEITTVHKSKGLEYDLVFLGDLGFSENPSRGKINFSLDHGVGINLENSSYVFKLNKEGEKKFEEEEGLRLFYVAMTRAKSALYILVSTDKTSGFMPFLDLDQEEFLTVSPLEKRTKKEDRPGAKRRVKALPKLRVEKEKPLLSPSALLMDQDPDPQEPYEYEGAQGQADLLGSLVHQYAAFARVPNKALREEILAQGEKSLSPEEVRRLGDLIDRYDQSLGERVLATEIPFLVEFEDFKLQGLIDQARERGGETILLDLKTGLAGARTPALEKYKKQIQLYGLSWEKIYGTRPRLELFFLEDGTRLEVEPMDLKDLEEVWERLFTIT